LFHHERLLYKNFEASHICPVGRCLRIPAHVSNSQEHYGFLEPYSADCVATASCRKGIGPMTGSHCCPVGTKVCGRDSCGVLGTVRFCDGRTQVHFGTRALGAFSTFHTERISLVLWLRLRIVGFVLLTIPCHVFLQVHI
jgi:hypothetical protein